MNTESLKASPTARLFKVALPAGLVAGALDMAYAIAVWYPRGVPPARVMKGIASGVLGAAAFGGGDGVALLGLALHLAIACAMAVVYVSVAERVPLLVQRPWLCGAVYGLLLYVAMNYLIVPLSAAPMRAPTGVGALVALIPHIVLIGWPFAWFTRRHALRADTPARARYITGRSA